MAFYHEMLTALWQIISAPFKDAAVFWVLAPILLLWIILELYFDMHKHEELGWNTALGNGISMFWITISLMKYLFDESFKHFGWSKFVAVLIILAYGTFISYISFAHTFSSKVTYLLAAPTPIYYMSVVAVVWAYGLLNITLWVLVDLIILFGIIVGIEQIIRHFMPESSKDEAGGSPGGEPGGLGGGGLGGL